MTLTLCSRLDRSSGAGSGAPSYFIYWRIDDARVLAARLREETQLLEQEREEERPFDIVDISAVCSCSLFLDESSKAPSDKESPRGVACSAYRLKEQCSSYVVDTDNY